jgi:hypothetical protein
MRLVTISLLLCVLGAVADDDPKKADGDKFKGDWKTLSVKQGGQVAPDEISKMMKFNFDGKKYVQTLGDQRRKGNTPSTRRKHRRRSTSTSSPATIRA